jgi:hypothetical protein
VGFEPSPFSPRVGLVVVIDVAQQQASGSFVNDQADIGTHSHGPKILILGMVDLVKTHPRICRVNLQVERRRLGCLLFVASQTRKAVREGIGNSDDHSAELAAFSGTT